MREKNIKRKEREKNIDRTKKQANKLNIKYKKKWKEDKMHVSK